MREHADPTRSIIEPPFIEQLPNHFIFYFPVLEPIMYFSFSNDRCEITTKTQFLKHCVTFNQFPSLGLLLYVCLYLLGDEGWRVTDTGGNRYGTGPCGAKCRENGAAQLPEKTSLSWLIEVTQ
jgi:hypothetical protein